MKKLTLTTALLSALTTVTAQAGDFTIIGGVMAFDSPYKDFKDDSGVYLDARYKNGNFSIDERGINYRVMGSDNDPLNLHVTLASAGTGYETGDSPVFAGMAERDASLDLGVSADYKLAGGVLNATLLHDISGAHEGLTADLSYGYDVALGGGISWQPRVGLTYASEDYSSYYFGVRSNEATATRVAYKADASVMPYAGYRLNVPFADSWSFVHEAAYAPLSDEIKNSPLVDKRDTWVASFGIGYSF